MGDEEKISLSKPERRSLQGGLAEFGLHCFPDIQVDEPENVEPCLSKEENFQRIEYDNMESNPTDMASRSDGDGSCNIRKG